MASFEQSVNIVLLHEGGLADHVFDKGGLTNRGITLATFKANADLIGVPPTSDSLKLLTVAQAKVIYRKAFWDKIKGDQLHSQEFANFFFDFFVNSYSNAVKNLQRSINVLGDNLKDDGSFGDKTFNALVSKNIKEVYAIFWKSREDFYAGIIARDPTQAVFKNGWSKRLNSFPKTIGGVTSTKSAIPVQADKPRNDNEVLVADEVVSKNMRKRNMKIGIVILLALFILGLIFYYKYLR